VTSSVQLFETLASNRPAKLRKMHEMPGSFFIFDEAQDSLPMRSWPLAWRWMNYFAKNWMCRFLLCSGALAPFWRIKKDEKWAKDAYLEVPCDIPEIVPKRLTSEMAKMEKKRIRYKFGEKFQTVDELIEFVLSKKGPWLNVMNTVRNTAYVALRFLDKMGNGILPEKMEDWPVLHLSSALIPWDKKIIMNEVNRRNGIILDEITRRCKRSLPDYAILATSCVQAGADISSRSGFRERNGLPAVTNAGGRVNRHGEYPCSTMWEYTICDPNLNSNPGFNQPIEVLESLLASWPGRMGKLSSWLQPCLLEAFRRLLENDTGKLKDRIEEVLYAEKKHDFVAVNENFKVIESNTRLVVIDNEMADRIAAGRLVPLRDMHPCSVQMWEHMIRRCRLVPISGVEEGDDRMTGDVYRWRRDNGDGTYEDLKYNRFLGYMAGVFDLEKRGLLQSGTDDLWLDF